MPACVFVYWVHALYPERPGEGAEFPWNWSYRWFCEPPCGCWQLNPGPLQELQEPALQELGVPRSPYTRFYHVRLLLSIKILFYFKVGVCVHEHTHKAQVPVEVRVLVLPGARVTGNCTPLDNMVSGTGRAVHVLNRRASSPH